jgi:hypothetical protein
MLPGIYLRHRSLLTDTGIANILFLKENTHSNALMYPPAFLIQIPISTIEQTKLNLSEIIL